MRFYRSVNNPLLNCGYMTVKSVQVTIQCHLSHLGSWYSLGLPGRVNCRGKKNHLDYNTVMLLLISNLIIFKIYFLHFRFKIKLIFMSELKHPLPPPQIPFPTCHPKMPLDFRTVTSKLFLP